MRHSKTRIRTLFTSRYKLKTVDSSNLDRIGPVIYGYLNARGTEEKVKHKIKELIKFDNKKEILVKIVHYT